MEQIPAKKKMMQALIELLSVKDFIDINVKELCLSAHINRTTFYAYYDNTYQLLEDTRKDNVKQFLSSFKDKAIPSLIPKDTDLLTKKYLVPYLEFIKKNKLIYQTYTTHSLESEANEFFENILEHVAKPIYLKSGGKDENELRYITTFFINGISSLVNLWIKRDFKESEDEIASLVENIAHHEWGIFGGLHPTT